MGGDGMGTELAIWVGLALLVGLVVGVILTRWLTQASNTTLTQVDTQLKSLDRFVQNIIHPQVDKLPMVEEDIRRIAASVEDLTAKLLGRQSGQVGERLVDELLSPLLDDWVARDVPLGNGQVEFAVKMPGEYFIPLDSKFVSSELVTGLDSESVSDQERKKIEQQINRQVQRRAGEIAQRYLVDKKALGFGIAAVPDAVYDLCRSAVVKTAQQNKIVVVPYSRLMPFVLSLYLMAQRLGISARLSETKQIIGDAQTLLHQAIHDLRNKQTAFMAVQNAYKETLDKMEQAEKNLRTTIEGDIALPQ